jgi:hypothetical protein
MKSYVSSQVVTVKELRPNMVLHCGTIGNRCIEWRVISKESNHAIIKVGESHVKMTGKDIRQGLPMFIPEHCPSCFSRKIIKDNAIPQSNAKVNTSYQNLTLEAANISSVLSTVDNIRKSPADPGGAVFLSKSSRRRNTRRQALNLAEKIVKSHQK